MATSFNRFYATELARLRANSLEFAQNNPAIAPMLGAVSTDPDVERLLEGVAFLNGLTLQKLDDEFPEIVQELASILVPQFLRPLPAASMLVFAPKTQLPEPALIKAGTEIGSTPVEGVACRFRTTTDVHTHPVSLEAVSSDQLTDGSQVLWLQFSCAEDASGAVLPPTLRLFLNQEYAAATNLMMMLGTQLKGMRLLDARGNSVSVLPKVHFPGFDESLLPYPDNAFPAFGWLQELLFFPQKFLFIEVPQLAQAQGTLKGDRFRVEFTFHKGATALPHLSPREFALNVTPVFQALTSGEQLTSAKLEYYRISPQGKEELYYTVEIKNAVVTSLRKYVPNCLDPLNKTMGHMEDVSFTYETIIETFTPNGIEAQDSWNAPKS